MIIFQDINDLKFSYLSIEKYGFKVILTIQKIRILEGMLNN